MPDEKKAVAPAAQEPEKKPGMTLTPLADLDGQVTQDFRNGLEAFRDQLQKALADRIPVDTFIEVATTAWLDTPKLRECSPLSIMRAIRRAAQLRLRPDGEEAAIIPYKGKAELQPMFKGIVRTMLRTRTVKKIEARVAKAGDHFRYAYGLNPLLEHTPAETEKRGETTYAYAIVWLTNGETQFEVIDRQELDGIQQWARGQRGGKDTPAWEDRPDEMRRKIAVKRLAKYVEMDAEQAAVLRFDDAADRGIADLVEIGDLNPEVEDRPLERRARDHAKRKVEELRRGMERMEQRTVVAEVVGASIQDQRVGFGTHRDKTWGELHAKLPGYVTHYVLGEECPWVEEGVKEALRTWLGIADGAAPSGDAPAVDPALMTGLLERGRAAIGTMMELQAMSDDEAADAGAEVGMAHDAGNFFALQDAVDELERAVVAKRAAQSGDLFGGRPA